MLPSLLANWAACIIPAVSRGSLQTPRPLRVDVCVVMMDWLQEDVMTCQASPRSEAVQRESRSPPPWPCGSSPVTNQFNCAMSSASTYRLCDFLPSHPNARGPRCLPNGREVEYGDTLLCSFVESTVDVCLRARQPFSTRWQLLCMSRVVDAGKVNYLRHGGRELFGSVRRQYLQISQLRCPVLGDVNNACRTVRITCGQEIAENLELEAFHSVCRVWS